MRSIALTEIFCRWMAFLIFKTFLVKLLFWMAMLKQVFNISLLQVVVKSQLLYKDNHAICTGTCIYKFSCTETFFISIKWLQRSIISFSQKNPLSRNLKSTTEVIDRFNSWKHTHIICVNNLDEDGNMENQWIDNNWK